MTTKGNTRQSNGNHSAELPPKRSSAMVVCPLSARAGGAGVTCSTDCVGEGRACATCVPRGVMVTTLSCGTGVLVEVASTVASSTDSVAVASKAGSVVGSTASVAVSSKAGSVVGSTVSSVALTTACATCVPRGVTVTTLSCGMAVLVAGASGEGVLVAGSVVLVGVVAGTSVAVGSAARA